jgi:DNA modification methylase
VFGLGPTSDGTFGYTIPKPSASRRHPTMKPPKLIFEQLRNSALPGEVVVDPFAGSGSTMIAAEQLGLRAFMIEYSEKYAAEIVDRWEHIDEEK